MNEITEIAKQVLGIAIKVGGPPLEQWFRDVTSGNTPEQSLTDQIKSLLPAEGESAKVAKELEAAQQA